MTAVIYARYSSDNQREESIEGQIRECTAYAEKNDITIVKHYIDRAISAKTDNRPQFQQMIKDSDKKLFDIVLVWKLDRFARNRYDSARYKTQLKKNGVKLMSATEIISEGPEGIILESVLEGYAEYYSADLAEKVVRGQTENILKGRCNGGRGTFGYTLDSERKFHIDPLASPFVLESFTKYRDGLTMKEIRDWLNENGIKNPVGGEFTYNSVEHMLKNRRYIGELKFRDVVVPDAIPPIVPLELFDDVQEKIAKNKKAPARRKAEDDYLLTTKLHCGCCGALMFGESGTSRTGEVHRYYKCATAKKKKGCKKKTVRKQWLEDLVVNQTMQLVRDDAAMESIIAKVMELQDRENTNLPLYEKQLRDAESGIQNMLNAIQAGILTSSTKERLEQLEETKRELEAPPVSKKEELRMKQTTFAQRLVSALVALCMVLSVCAPALAAEPEIGSAAMITLTKGGTTTGLKMPEGNVSLSAEYQNTYQIFETAGKAEFFAEGAEEQKIHEALPGTRIIAKVPDSELNDYRQFNMWRLVSEKELVEPDQNWQGKQSFRFTMPEGDVELQAFFTTLYDVNVTHGTIVDETSETGASQKIVKPGQLVTVRAESTEENPFLQWTYTGKAPVEPDDGWQTSKEFTFKMPNGNVTLEAQRDQLYKVSINDSLGSVTINGEQRSSLWVKEGETVTVATTLKDGYWMEFMKWTAQDGSTTPVEPSDNWQTSTTFTFKMPNGPVELVAQWSASSLDPEQRIDPDEPLDEDFGVEPAPMDTTGGTIAAVAVGGAAIWGGYEIATRVILHNLLPEGAAIPANRGQLALLIWTEKGKPEPAAQPAFADITDAELAKAAQWCVEQGLLDAREGKFESDGWMPKFKTIEIWNKAFPKK